MIFILSSIPLHGINMRIYYRYKSERMPCGQRLDQVEYRLEVSSVTFAFTFATQRLLPILYETISITPRMILVRTFKNKLQITQIINNKDVN